MAISPVNSKNNYNMLATKPAKNNETQSSFSSHNNQEKAPTKVKVASIIGTLLGISGAMFFTFKSKAKDGVELKNLKDYFHNLISINYKKPEEEGGKVIGDMEKLIGRLAIGSVGGGFLFGGLADKKENLKAKARESIIQLVGNILTPILCVDAGLRIYEKFAEKKILAHIKSTSKSVKGLPKAAFSILFLIGGLLLGNKVSNTINAKAFKVDDKRKIKVSDLSPQLDDVCVAAGFVLKEGKIGTIASRFIPLAFTFAGYDTGTAQENPKNLKPKTDTIAA